MNKSHEFLAANLSQGSLEHIPFLQSLLDVQLAEEAQGEAV